MIGDHIIFRLEPNKFLTVGRAPVSNWIMFQAAIGKWNVKVSHDPRSDLAPRRQGDLPHPLPVPDPGPDADKIFEKINGGSGCRR
ncbi:MAG: hypothetical protein R3D80_04000 [Paracoccaceae bacterium]